MAQSWSWGSQIAVKKKILYMLDDVHLKCLDQLDASVDVYQHTGDQLHNSPPSQEIPLSRIL